MALNFGTGLVAVMVAGGLTLAGCGEAPATETADTADTAPAEAEAAPEIVGVWVHSRTGADDMNLRWDVRPDGTIAVSSPDDPATETEPMIYGWSETSEGDYEMHALPSTGTPGPAVRVEDDVMIWSPPPGDVEFQRES